MKVFAIFATIGIVILLLVHGSEILIPVMIAIFFWHLIRAITDGLSYKFNIPYSISLIAAILFILIFFVLPINLAIFTLPEVLQESLKYQTQIDALIEKFMKMFSLSKEDIFNQIKNFINIPTLISLFAGTLTAFTTNIILIVLYTAFLLYDQRFLPRKMQEMFPHVKDQQWILGVIDRISIKIKNYIYVKTILAALGGIFSYIIFLIIGLHFAEFWAIMIFFLGYIPTIGAFLGTIFPALLCLVQFPTIYPFLTVFFGCGSVHFLIGNVLEPKLLGDSMNLSPFIVLFSLILWTFLWGIIGAFLSVPITMIILIICAEFPKTRPIAIALSAKGKV